MSTDSAYNDETLCAYIDGELAADERARLDQALATDPGLRERLEQLRGVTQLLQEELSAPDDEPVPEGLLNAARALAQDRRASDNVVALSPKPRRIEVARWQVGIAAAVTLVVGGVLGAGWQMLNNEATLDTRIASLDAGRIGPENPLHDALESTISGDSVTLADQSRIRLILSFAATDGRFCREFDVAATNAASVGVACREAGAWRLEVLLAAKPQDTGTYAPASGFNSRALEDVVSALMKDAPLGPNEERDLITRGWQQ
jgi:hypothetical protein